MQFIRAVCVAVVPMLAGSACRETPLLSPVPGLQAAVPSGAVRAEITELPLHGDGMTTFIVRVRSRNTALSAFQGTLTFTPGAFELVQLDAPQRGGESFLFNPDEFAAGRVRFAGLSPTPFAGLAAGDAVDALRLTVRPLRPMAEANLQVSLDIASVESGASLDARHLLPSRFEPTRGAAK